MDGWKFSCTPTSLYGVLGSGQLPLRSREFYPGALEDQTQVNPVLKTWVKPESSVGQRHKEFATQPEPQTSCFGKTEGHSIVA